MATGIAIIRFAKLSVPSTTIWGKVSGFRFNKEDSLLFTPETRNCYNAAFFNIPYAIVRLDGTKILLVNVLYTF